MTSADHCRISRACWTEPGTPPSTPSGWSRTSQPWQYGQCSRSWPHRSTDPGNVGQFVADPVAIKIRRAVTVRALASRTVNPGPMPRT